MSGEDVETLANEVLAQLADVIDRDEKVDRKVNNEALITLDPSYSQLI